jgi:hypothetical protein
MQIYSYLVELTASHGELQDGRSSSGSESESGHVSQTTSACLMKRLHIRGSRKAKRRKVSKLELSDSEPDSQKLSNFDPMFGTFNECGSTLRNT